MDEKRTPIEKKDLIAMIERSLEKIDEIAKIFDRIDEFDESMRRIELRLLRCRANRRG